MNYFAYGSNMLAGRLRERVPSAKPLGRATLAGHRLAWHKRSTDGSGKCDIVETGEDADIVHGVLFEMDPYEKPQLDRAEGLGNGYDQKRVDVMHEGKSKPAITYYVPHVDSRLKPYHWYKAFVVAGAKENGLPADYIGEIEKADSVQDANTDRREKNGRILEQCQQSAAHLQLDRARSS